jgi:hypothetical protein
LEVTFKGGAQPMAQCNEDNINDMLTFLFKAPCDEEIVDMDCNDYCEQLARLAEEVAGGADLKQLLPALEEHIRHYADCREEFEALVNVIRAEKSGALSTSDSTSDHQSQQPDSK